MRDFDHVLAEFGGDFSAWQPVRNSHESSAITDAAIEVLSLPSNVYWTGSALAFRTDTRVYDLGVVDGPQGTIWHAILLRMPDALEIVAAIEDDRIRAETAYRGNAETFARMCQGLWLFQGRCFAHLREGLAI